LQKKAFGVSKLVGRLRATVGQKKHLVGHLRAIVGHLRAVNQTYPQNSSTYPQNRAWLGDLIGEQAEKASISRTGLQ
jgi:hypothetical protein